MGQSTKMSQDDSNNDQQSCNNYSRHFWFVELTFFQLSVAKNSEFRYCLSGIVPSTRFRWSCCYFWFSVSVAFIWRHVLLTELSVTLGNSIVGWRQFYMTSSIGWMFPRGLSTRLARWCTDVCTDRHLATLQTTSSQPQMLHPVVFAYDQPTGTVSLYLAVDSARMAVGRSTSPARQSGTRYLMNLEILTVLITLNGLWKQFSLVATSACPAH